MMNKKYIKQSEASQRPITPHCAKLCVSLHPGEMATLKSRCRDFCLPASRIIQVLLQVEGRQHLIRREVALRLRALVPPVVNGKEKTHE
ncbi:MAG: hypothetical protein NT154_12030 [Verrucomicrobia bacterium]|nr:hypothetical protein [Verrucomicrobiota bacterium]